MKKPIIGININYPKEHKYCSIDKKYVDSVTAAGGVPMVLPLFNDLESAKQALESVDGIVFTGGADINPMRFGQKAHEKYDPLRPEKERSDEMLIKLALDMKKNILAICYGCQLLNVALGGTLHQHLPDLDFGAHKKTKAEHKVVIEPPLSDVMGMTGTIVNSYHHQGIDKLGEGLKIVAKAEDGLTEGIMLPKSFIVGIQWHPERMKEQEQQKLFKALVENCK